MSARARHAALLATLAAMACASPAVSSAPADAGARPSPDAGASAAIDCAGAQPGDRLLILHQWRGQEQLRFATILAPLVEACGLHIEDRSAVQKELTEAVSAGSLDVGVFGTAELENYQAKLVTLDALGAHPESYADFFLAPGTVRGRWLGLAVKTDIKTIVWYSPRVFAEKGYAVPKTWGELVALADTMAARGDVAWSMGFESPESSGWSGSDFIQDILLVEQGPGFVLDLLTGKVTYDHAGVRRAYETYGRWAKDARYAAGGADGTAKTPFLEAIYKVFATPPQALMVKQSGFAQSEIAKKYPDLRFGSDYDFFFVPEAKGLQGGADWMMAFRDSRAVRALVGYLSSSRGGARWAESGLDLSPNRGARGNYVDPALSRRGEALASATGFTPDIGDAIPGDFKLAEWKAIVDYVGGADLDAVLAEVARAQAEALR